MKQAATELVFILDRSGSMAGLVRDTIGGFNSMLSQQREADGPCRVTTVLFDRRSTLLHDRIDIQAVAPMTAKDYTVGGSTALLDAIGSAIGKLTAVRKSTAAEYSPGKVLFVIITDGEENSSREFTADRIRAMIRERQEEFGWEFIFLGANIDAVETAARYNIPPSRAAEYVPDAQGTDLNFSTVSQAVLSFRADCPLADDCLDSIRADRKNRGKK